MVKPSFQFFGFDMFSLTLVKYPPLWGLIVLDFIIYVLKFNELRGLTLFVCNHSNLETHGYNVENLFLIWVHDYRA